MRSSCETLVNKATTTALARSEDPPYDMKGRVTPVIGKRRRMPAMIRTAWRPMRIVTPAARYLRNRSRERSAMPNPTVTNRAKPVSTAIEPANPNSATVLVVGDDPPPGAWAATFEEVHDLLAPGEGGEERRLFWERWQEDPETDLKEEM